MLSKAKYHGMFDMAFVSSRVVHALDQPFFKKLLRDKVCVPIVANRPHSPQS